MEEERNNKDILKEADTPESSNEEGITRREFLERVRNAAALAALSKIPGWMRPNQESLDNSPERVVVETENAIYIPLYEESHFKGITHDEIVEAGPTEYFFYEFATPSYGAAQITRSQLTDLEGGTLAMTGALGLTVEQISFDAKLMEKPSKLPTAYAVGISLIQASLAPNPLALDTLCSF